MRPFALIFDNLMTKVAPNVNKLRRSTSSQKPSNIFILLNMFDKSNKQWRFGKGLFFYTNHLCFSSGPKLDDIGDVFLYGYSACRVMLGLRSVFCFECVFDKVIFVFFANQSPIRIGDTRDLHAPTAIQNRATFDNTSKEFTLSVRWSTCNGTDFLKATNDGFRLCCCNHWSALSQNNVRHFYRTGRKWVWERNNGMLLPLFWSLAVRTNIRPVPKLFSFEQSSGRVFPKDKLICPMNWTRGIWREEKNVRFHLFDCDLLFTRVRVCFLF